jgi:O-antigen/teichoic acid export membrane protein
VGLLDWSMNIASLPRVLSDNIGRVAFASFSQLQNRKDIISLTIKKTFNGLSFFTLFPIILIFGFGNQIIHYVLTDKWLPALPALYWFSLGAIFFNGTAILGQGLLALGKVKKMFILSVPLIIFELLLAYILLSLIGFVGVAIASCLGVILFFFAYIIIANRMGIKINLKELFLSKIIIFVLCIGLSFTLNYFNDASFVYLIVKCIAVLILYLLLYYSFEKAELQSNINLFKQHILTK